PGWLRLFSQAVPGADLAKAGDLLLQKFPARTFRVETELEFSPALEGEGAGIVVRGLAPGALGVRHRSQGPHVFFRPKTRDQLLQPVTGNRFAFRVDVADGGECQFSFRADDGTWVPAPRTFRAEAGFWVGAKVGIYSLRPDGAGSGAHADFSYFRFATA